MNVSNETDWNAKAYELLCRAGDALSECSFDGDLEEEIQEFVKIVAPSSAARDSDARPPADWLNRRAEVEQELFDVANGKRALPDEVQCRAWAMRLGVPSNWEEYGKVKDATGRLSSK